MKKKKSLILLGNACIVLLLAILPITAGSQGPAPAPRPVVEINLQTSKMGGSGYIMSFALADIIKKNHPWLRVNAIETTGLTENLMTLANEPEQRQKTAIFADDVSRYQAKMGYPPFKVYDTLRAIASFGAHSYFVVTTNPNLKTWHDFIGKKVGTFPKGSGSAEIWWDILEYGYGIKPQAVNWVHVPMGPGHDSLSDGRLEATWSIAGPPPYYTLTPPLEMLKAARRVYFIGFSKEALNAAKEKTGRPAYGFLIEAGTLAPGQAALFSQVSALSWWADVKMDEKVVYEITKTIYEHVDKFASYHALGKAMTKANLALMGGGKEVFHPGAVRFYEEKGVKIGM